MPRSQELSKALRAGRRALEGMLGVELLGDWMWSDDAGCWVLHCSLSADVASGGPIPATTHWYVWANGSYPWGEIEFYPAKVGGILKTFPHQLYNAPGQPGLPWRTGNICVRTGVRAIGRRAYDSEPYDADRRLRWNFERALEWLSDASRGQLIGPGDPFELPPLPPASDTGRVIFSESRETFGLWSGISDRAGFIDLAPLRSKRERLVAVAFRSSAGEVLSARKWGQALEGLWEPSQQTGVWVRLEGPPSLPPYEIPSTWEGLREACRAQGHPLDELLRPLAPALRDGKVHIALLGFPIPDRVGEPPCQMHWLAVRLPVLSSHGKVLAGFRSNERGYWHRDHTQVLRTEPVQWLISENWHDDEISTRGRLPEALRTRSILLLGGGALGSVVGELLVRGGVYDLLIVDHDKLAVGNLVRHTLSLTEVGEPKAEGLARRLNHASPHAAVRHVNTKFPPSSDEEVQAVSGCDVVVDCTVSDEVLHQLEQFDWGARKVFFSASLGLDGRRLFCFMAVADCFPHAAFRELVHPWLEQELLEHNGRELPREGIGCWHPVFRARADDVWMMACGAVKELERCVASPPTEAVLRVYGQDYEGDAFAGIRLLAERRCAHA